MAHNHCGELRQYGRRCGGSVGVPVKALGFVALGVAAVFLYSGWLGVSPGTLTRDLLTGTPLPPRRTVNSPGSDTASGAGMPMPGAGSGGGRAGTYPLPSGDTVPA